MLRKVAVSLGVVIIGVASAVSIARADLEDEIASIMEVKNRITVMQGNVATILGETQSEGVRQKARELEQRLQHLYNDAEVLLDFAESQL